MSEPIVAISQNPETGVLCLTLSETVDDPQPTKVWYFKASHAPSIRKALNARYKEQKAAKKAERRFYVTNALARGCWQVRDRNYESYVMSEHFGESPEAYAKAFAKLLNKQARKEASQ